jgi:hypothetical protein
MNRGISQFVNITEIEVREHTMKILGAVVIEGRSRMTSRGFVFEWRDSALPLIVKKVM